MFVLAFSSKSVHAPPRSSTSTGKVRGGTFSSSGTQTTAVTLVNTRRPSSTLMPWLTRVTSAVPVQGDG